jgi:hypothetical protein
MYSREGTFEGGGISGAIPNLIKVKLLIHTIQRLFVRLCPISSLEDV